MAKRRTSILKDRKIRLEAQVEILSLVGKDIKHKGKESEKKFLDTQFRTEVRLDEVLDLLKAEEGKNLHAPEKSKPPFYVLGMDDSIPLDSPLLKDNSGLKAMPAPEAPSEVDSDQEPDQCLSSEDDPDSKLKATPALETSSRNELSPGDGGPYPIGDDSDSPEKGDPA